MAKIYYRLVVAGERTLDSVPERWRQVIGCSPIHPVAARRSLITAPPTPHASWGR